MFILLWQGLDFMSVCNSLIIPILKLSEKVFRVFDAKFLHKWHMIFDNSFEYTRYGSCILLITSMKLLLAVTWIQNEWK